MTHPESRRHRIRVALAVALAAAAAIAVWKLGAAPIAMPPREEAGESEIPPAVSAPQGADDEVGTGSTTAAPAETQDVTPPPSPQPLPDANTPLVDVIDAMEDRARRGEVRAACWVGEALRQCHAHSARERQAIDSDEQIAERIARQNLSAAEQDRQLRGALRRRDEAQRLGRVCEALPRERSRRAPYFLLQAGQAGHVPSVLRFVQLDPYSGAIDMVADPALAQLFHQHAVPMLIRALETGSPAAIFQWNLQLMPGTVSLVRDRLPPELSHDRVAAAVSERVMAQVWERMLSAGQIDPRSTAPLSPSPPLPAEEQVLADQLYDRFIGDGRGLQRALDRIQPGAEPFTPPADDLTGCNESWPD